MTRAAPEPGADMTGRVCLVTGATSGHGRAVAAALARRGAAVVLLGRSADKCRAVRKEIAEETGGRAPDVLLCDLAVRSDIARAADEWLASDRPLHVLVNNAGLVNLERQETVDGVEMVFAVNYLATFELTLRLLPRMLESAPARVVNVSSDTHRIARLDLDDLELRSGYGWLRSYGRSKAALTYFTRELARRLEGTGVTANAVDPGPVASAIGGNNPGLAYSLLGPVIRGLFPSADRAARTALHLCTAPELAATSGGYYKGMRLRMPRVPREEETSSALWTESATRTGVGLPGAGATGP